MHPYLLVALGSAFGGVSRFWLSALVAQKYGDGFPWGTILVNVSGCFLIGLSDAWINANDRIVFSSGLRQFLMIGVLGGYTTFSSFSLQTLHLTDNGRWVGAAGNVCGSVLLCLAAVWLGQWCGQLLARQP